ncbi:MAG: hypothetical protein AAGC55_19255, partial [Myxococcota bacterium]
MTRLRTATPILDRIRVRVRPSQTALIALTLMLAAAGCAESEPPLAPPSSADEGALSAELSALGFPFQSRFVDLSGYLSDDYLLYHPVDNPLGVFTSADDD